MRVLVSLSFVLAVLGDSLGDLTFSATRPFLRVAFAPFFLIYEIALTLCAVCGIQDSLRTSV